LVGCSGWQYRHWRGTFYPREVPAAEWLVYYARRFRTVELNGSFYRLPEIETVRGWRRELPTGFRMAFKASRYLTHRRRLREPAEPLHRLWTRADELKEHLGPMLYQLPPRWHRNRERLAAFAGALPDRLQAIEFRDPDWYAEEIDLLLVRAGLARCIHDMPGSAAPCTPLGPFVYVRFHGAGDRYRGGYSPQLLGAWADRLAEWAEAGLDAYVYFNNDLGGHAPVDASRLRELLGRRGIG